MTTARFAQLFHFFSKHQVGHDIRVHFQTDNNDNDSGHDTEQGVESHHEQDVCDRNKVYTEKQKVDGQHDTGRYDRPRMQEYEVERDNEEKRQGDDEKGEELQVAKQDGEADS